MEQCRTTRCLVAHGRGLPKVDVKNIRKPEEYNGDRSRWSHLELVVVLGSISATTARRSSRAKRRRPQQRWRRRGAMQTRDFLYGRSIPKQVSRHCRGGPNLFASSIEGQLLRAAGAVAELLGGGGRQRSGSDRHRLPRARQWNARQREGQMQKQVRATARSTRVKLGRLFLEVQGPLLGEERGPRKLRGDEVPRLLQDLP